MIKWDGKFLSCITLQSVVDATTPPQALINTFLKRLAANGHELVLFDVSIPSLAGVLLLLLESSDKPRRNIVFQKTYLGYGYTLKETTDQMSLHYTTMNRVISDQKRN